MRTVSTLLISTATIVALLSGASMAMRTTAPGDHAQGPSRAARAVQAGSVETWADPPARAAVQTGSATSTASAGLHAMAGEAPEDRSEHARVAEAKPDSAPSNPEPGPREASRRIVARIETPRRAEDARAQRRAVQAQASRRARVAVARTAPAPRAEVASRPARPIDPISDFLRGVGLIDDGHG